MKKIISTAISLVLTAAYTAPAVLAADETPEYIPSMYFRANESDGIAPGKDGNVVLFRSDQPENSEIVVNASVFIADESLTCWYVHPVWKCASGHVVLDGLVDPVPMQDGVPNLEYAYAEKDENGELTSKLYGTLVSRDERYNTLSFTSQVVSKTNRAPMVPYGEKSDSYPLTSFDMHIAADAPDGVYEVYFLAQAEDYEDQRTTQVGMRNADGSVIAAPEMTPLKVTLTSALFGDVNGDKKVDSNDASAVLAAYSKVSTGAEHGLSDVQAACGDTDRDGQLSSKDASAILSYYTYLSTNGEDVKTLAEFLK